MDKSAITEIAIRLGWSELWLPFVLLAVLQFLLALLVKTRLEGSIKHDYDKKLEQLRFDVQVRQQAAKIAELMSEARDGGTVLSKEHATKLNKLMWDLSLWLPPQIVRDLTVHICYAKD